MAKEKEVTVWDMIAMVLEAVNTTYKKEKEIKD
jgi:hypothetical protein